MFKTNPLLDQYLYLADIAIYEDVAAIEICVNDTGFMPV